MTKKRLKEIFIETVFPTVGITDETLLWFETRDLKEDYIEAMKRAVNEAIQECADNAEAHLSDSLMTQQGYIANVDKSTIINLKVK